MRIGSWIQFSLNALPLTGAAPVRVSPQHAQAVLQAPTHLDIPQTPMLPSPRPPAPDTVNINGKAIPTAEVERFAPIVQFHPDERFMPCSVEFLLQNTTLVDGRGHTITTHPTQADLQAHPNKPTRLILNKAFYAGEPLDAEGRVQAPMYVSIQVPNDHAFVDFSYIFLFNYNGAQTARVRIPYVSYNVELPQFAEHDGDVEGITVRVEPDFSAMRHVRLEGHGHSVYVPPENMTLQDDHPVVRSALNSHATHANGTDPWVATTSIVASGFGIEFLDVVSHRGAQWAPTRDQLVLVGLDAQGNPLGHQRWAAYAGFIGAHWHNSFLGARGVGNTHLALWQRLLADAIAYTVQATGITRFFSGSDGTDGLGERTFINSTQPLI